MSKIKYLYIQFHASVFLLGYLLMHTVLSAITGGASHGASIAFNGFMLVSSIYVMAICHGDIIIEHGKNFLNVFSIVMILYSLRMFFDIYSGPFSMIVPLKNMWDDFLRTVGGTFLPTWAIISSRRYIDIEKISTLSFWFGLVTCLFTIYILQTQGITSYEEGRVDLSSGLHSLSLVKLGAIEIIAALHVIINNKKKLIWFVGCLGLILGGFIALISGSRGGVVGVVIAIAVYIIMRNRKRPLLMLVSSIVVMIFIINIVPILTWISDFFPVFGNRMLEAVIDMDTSNRDILWEQAMGFILENPVLGYSYRLNTDLTGYGPHNGILEVALCLGIPIAALFVYYAYIKAFKYATIMMLDHRYIFVSLITVFAIVSSMSSTSLSNGIFDFAISIVGIAYYYSRRNLPKKYHIANVKIL